MGRNQSVLILASSSSMLPPSLFMERMNTRYIITTMKAGIKAVGRLLVA